MFACVGMWNSRRALALLAALATLACGGDASDRPEPSGSASAVAAPAREGPATANWSIYEPLRAAMERPRHPSDGGGRAFLEPGPGDTTVATSATPGRFRIVYEAGAAGVARGGRVVLKVSHFAGMWSPPQVGDPEAPGYTTAQSEDPTIELRATPLPRNAVEFQVVGRPLVAGDQITVVYGAGPKRARAGRYAGRDVRFWIGVDGDGDGNLAMLPDSPTLDVQPRDAAALLVHLPTTARPGEVVRVRLAFVDRWRNAEIPISAEVTLESTPEGLALPDRIALAAADRGLASVDASASLPGIYRVRATSGRFRADSNLIVVSPDEPRVIWADLHGHSQLSDGVGTPDDYYRYARDVSALDVAALTDHDHYGILPLDGAPELWEQIQDAARRFHEPGRFVTLLGYEWTNWIHGHRHVLYFADSGRLYSALDPATETPQQLWAALAGRDVLTFAHHSAGGPVATNWDIPPDPVLEPLTEIVSVHGSSEAPDSPAPLQPSVAGNFVRDALDRGYRLGFVGSGDTHDGHPGAYQRAPVLGGLAGILSQDLTREAVLEALRARRVYASNGPRMLLRTTLAGQPMGAAIPVGDGVAEAELQVRVVADAPLSRVDLIRSGHVVESVAAGGRLVFELKISLRELRPGEYLYVRAVQRNDGAVWSSPYWFE